MNPLPPAPLEIVIDTREQTPWHFPEELATVSRGTLKAGDYALNGDPFFSIERKSMDDFTGTISSGWERFQNEIERMGEYPARIVIIEGTFMQVIEHGYGHPEVLPVFVLKQMAKLLLKGVAIEFADNPQTAAGLCYVILKERSEQFKNDNDDNSDSQPSDLPEA